MIDWPAGQTQRDRWSSVDLGLLRNSAVNSISKIPSSEHSFFLQRRCSHSQTLLVGGFNPSEKYESQLGWIFPIYGKIKNVPNHQPAMFTFANSDSLPGDILIVHIVTKKKRNGWFLKSSFLWSPVSHPAAINHVARLPFQVLLQV